MLTIPRTLCCNINQHISVHEINLELEKMSHWFSSNKLSLNMREENKVYIYMYMFISYSHGILLYYDKHYYEYTQ